ncbi:hypothetical protein Dimus_031325 [Dionaea muscipula]
MEQAPLKRQREEIADEGDEGDLVMMTKRQKPSCFNDIISILEGDEEEPIHDLSSLITTLQQEISTSLFSTDDDPLLNDHITLLGSSSSNPSSITSSSEADPCEFIDASAPAVEYMSSVSFPVGDVLKEGDEEKEREKEMRHLLEASDDELGIPSADGGVDELVVGEINGGDDLMGLDDGLLWELEDEAANYYTLLQSELFL